MDAGHGITRAFNQQIPHRRIEHGSIAGNQALIICVSSHRRQCYSAARTAFTAGTENAALCDLCSNVHRRTSGNPVRPSYPQSYPQAACCFHVIHTKRIVFHRECHILGKLSTNLSLALWITCLKVWISCIFGERSGPRYTRTKMSAKSNPAENVILHHDNGSGRDSRNILEFSHSLRPRSILPAKHAGK